MVEILGMIIQKPDGKVIVDYRTIEELEEKHHLTPREVFRIIFVESLTRTLHEYETNLFKLADD